MNRSYCKGYKRVFSSLSCLVYFLVFSLGAFGHLIAQSDGEAKKDDTGQEKVSADVVIEKYELSIDVLAPNKVNAHYKILYRVYEPEGVPLVQFYRIIDQYRRLSSLRMRLSDSEGRLVKELGKKEMVNRSYASDYSLMEDNRLVYLPPLEPSEYPYYVALDYSMEFQSAFFLPSFYPVLNYGVALEEGVLKVKDHGKARTKFKVNNYSEETVKEVSPGEFEFRIKDVEAIRREDMAPPILQMVPWVELVPGRFNMDQTYGGFASWREFGGWFAHLGNQENTLSAETIREIKALTAGLDSKEAKAAKIYQYLQSNTRYVSIQLGIGGYKPFPAGKVDQWGYGDCKALSNYMVTMLKEVGVEAFYTLIYSGKNNQRTSMDFPANNFNHAIVCLPLDGDTLWMECTSQVLPFNYLGASTADRYALLIKEGGSQLVRTPKPKAAGTVQDTRMAVQVAEDGTIAVKLKRNATGEFLGLYGDLANASTGDTEKWMRRKFGQTSTVFSDVKFSMDGQQGQLSFEMVQPQAARKTGKYLFVPRDFENDAKGIDPVDDPNMRKNPIHIHSPQKLRYGWDISVPKGFEASRIPKDVLVENKFGRLEQTSVLEEGHLMAEVELILNQGVYPAEDAGLFNALAHGWKKSTASKWVFTSLE